jgi:hypothetical protein
MPPAGPAPPYRFAADAQDDGQGNDGLAVGTGTFTMDASGAGQSHSEEMAP